MSFWFFVGTVVVSLTLHPRLVAVLLTPLSRKFTVNGRLTAPGGHEVRNFGPGYGSEPERHDPMLATQTRQRLIQQRSSDR
jgi:hypothetical protein